MSPVEPIWKPASGDESPVLAALHDLLMSRWQHDHLRWVLVADTAREAGVDWSTREQVDIGLAELLGRRVPQRQGPGRAWGYALVDLWVAVICARHADGVRDPLAACLPYHFAAEFVAALRLVFAVHAESDAGSPTALQRSWRAQRLGVPQRHRTRLATLLLDHHVAVASWLNRDTTVRTTRSPSASGSLPPLTTGGGTDRRLRSSLNAATRIEDDDRRECDLAARVARLGRLLADAGAELDLLVAEIRHDGSVGTQLVPADQVMATPPHRDA